MSDGHARYLRINTYVIFQWCDISMGKITIFGGKITIFGAKEALFRRVQLDKKAEKRTYCNHGATF